MKDERFFVIVMLDDAGRPESILGPWPDRQKAVFHAKTKLDPQANWICKETSQPI